MVEVRGKEPEPLTEVQDLDSLALADDTIVREWRKQAVWTRALYKHVQECAVGKQEEKFAKDYKSTHEKIWGKTLKVVGIPREGTSGMEE